MVAVQGQAQGPAAAALVSPAYTAAAATPAGPGAAPGAVTTAPSAIGAPFAMLDPGVSPGGVTVAPGVTGSFEFVPAPATTTVSSVAARATEAGSGIGAVVVTPGPITLAPSRGDIASTAFASSSAPGAVSVGATTALGETWLSAPSTAVVAVSVHPLGLDVAVAEHAPGISPGPVVIASVWIGATAGVTALASNVGSVVIQAGIIEARGTPPSPAATPGAVSLVSAALPAKAEVFALAATLSAVSIRPNLAGAETSIPAIAAAPQAVAVALLGWGPTALLWPPSVVPTQIVAPASAAGHGGGYAPGMAPGPATLALSATGSVASVAATRAEPQPVAVSPVGMGAAVVPQPGVLIPPAVTVLASRGDASSSVGPLSAGVGAVAVAPLEVAGGELVAPLGAAPGPVAADLSPLAAASRAFDIAPSAVVRPQLLNVAAREHPPGAAAGAVVVALATVDGEGAPSSWSMEAGEVSIRPQSFALESLFSEAQIVARIGMPVLWAPTWVGVDALWKPPSSRPAGSYTVSFGVEREAVASGPSQATASGGEQTTATVRSELRVTVAGRRDPTT